jgi:hypothetical protein
MNPFKTICERLGVDPEALAKRAGVEVSDLRESLSGEPPGPVAALLKGAETMGIKWRVYAVRPFRFWASFAGVDALITSSRFRRDQGIEPLPKTIGEVRKLAHRMHKDGKSYQKIIRHMMGNWIPTFEGGRIWNQGPLGHMLKRADVQKGDDGPLKFSEEFRSDWRRRVLQLLVAEIFNFAPKAVLDYGVEPGLTQDRIVLNSSSPMPDAYLDWAKDNAAGLGWFDPIHWGFNEESMDGIGEEGFPGSNGPTGGQPDARDHDRDVEDQ